MPGLIRNLRARSFDALWQAAMLLAAAGMTAVGLENVSFGHEHLAGGHALHHHHVYLGSHEHPDDHEHGHHHDDHDHDAPVPQDRPTSHGTATVSAAPALFQPVPVSVLAVDRTDATPLVAVLTLPPAARPAAQPSPPRGPPLSSTAPDSLD